MQRALVILMLWSVFFRAYPGEGMWIPLFLDSLNFKDMQEKGLRLSPEEIYSINQPSLKDAVVIFGGGCTGELISPDGLVITNHHCGFSRIQAHSTIEHNYLADGFWAGSRAEELANPGLTVTFLVKMENVTAQVLDGVTESMPEPERIQKVAMNTHEILNQARVNSHYQAEIKPFYFGKEYYLFIYEIFRDVRLVGTPPEAIGNFGGDTDNWIWPRHTGDFSLFRIYADKDNKPADYSPDNIPYKPAKYLNISVGGVKEGDFTMILGYPGRTDQYLISEHLQLISDSILPAKIDMRTARLDVIKEIMNRGPADKLRYANKHKNISNSWKKWIGVTKGVERADVIARKKSIEKTFMDWASSKPEYASLMNDFSRVFKEYARLYKSYEIGGELLNSIELSAITERTQLRFFSMTDSSAEAKKKVIADLKSYGNQFYKSNAIEIDQRVLPRLLQIYAKSAGNNQLPAFYQKIETTYDNNYDAFVADILKKSMFGGPENYQRIIVKSEKAIRKAIINDPLIAIYRDFAILLTGNNAEERLDSLELELKKFYRQYLTGLMSMSPEKVFYPDANFTMRLTYGQVEGYEPLDAVDYSYYSTLTGIMEKDDPEIPDYIVPQKLRQLYESDEKGSYLQEGQVPVCFIASNHTSGGNSGSPVVNANGNLIGINFDRNWEGTVSDYAYDPVVCRNISLDIRYVIYIIDKLANADWLLDELTLTNN